MFRVKTTRRNVKRAVSPLRQATDVPATVTASAIISVVPPPVAESYEKQISNFFEAESAATALTKPWLRLERGLRMQRFRAFADVYPGLSIEEKENLYKVLMKANDSKILNTKQQISYENGKILAIKGLKIIRTGDPKAPAVFKIDVSRPTKKNTEE
jgi:hypothetical protein